MNLHILYSDKKEKFHMWSTNQFKTIEKAEEYLRSIKAKRWDIGVKDEIETNQRNGLRKRFQW